MPHEYAWLTSVQLAVPPSGAAQFAPHAPQLFVSMETQRPPQASSDEEQDGLSVPASSPFGESIPASVAATVPASLVASPALASLPAGLTTTTMPASESSGFWAASKTLPSGCDPWAVKPVPPLQATACVPRSAHPATRNLRRQKASWLDIFSPLCPC